MPEPDDPSAWQLPEELLTTILQESLARGFPRRVQLEALHARALRAGPSDPPRYSEFTGWVQLTEVGLDQCLDPAALRELAGLRRTRAALAEWSRALAQTDPRRIEGVLGVAELAAALGFEQRGLARHLSMLVTEAPRASECDRETGFVQKVRLQPRLLWADAPAVSCPADRLVIEEREDGKVAIVLDGEVALSARAPSVGIRALRAMVSARRRCLHVLDLGGIVDGELTAEACIVYSPEELRTQVLAVAPQASVRADLTPKECRRRSACLRALTRVVAKPAREALFEAIRGRYSRAKHPRGPIERASDRLRKGLYRAIKHDSPELVTYLAQALKQGENWCLDDAWPRDLT